MLETNSPAEHPHTPGGFEQFLDYTGSICPEIAAKRESLNQAAQELVGTYEPHPDFFNVNDNAVGLLLAAGLHADALDTAGKSATRTEFEQTFAYNFARTLLGPYSERYPLEDLPPVSDLEPEARLASYRRYENQALSERLKGWFATDPSIAETNLLLQIPNEARHNCEIIVLSAAAPYTFKGLRINSASPLADKHYRRMLIANNASFSAEQRWPDDLGLPRGWVDGAQDTTCLCIPEVEASLLLEPHNFTFGRRAQKHNGDDLLRIKDIMRHEYVHSLGVVRLKDPSRDDATRFLGKVIEEYRAEVFSDHPSEEVYADVYSIAASFKDWGGTDLGHIMRSLPLGGALNKAEFYATVARQAGLVETAMLTGFVTSDTYAEAPKSVRAMRDTLLHTSLGQRLILRASDEKLRAIITLTDPESVDRLWEYAQKTKQELA